MYINHSFTCVHNMNSTSLNCLGLRVKQQVDKVKALVQDVDLLLHCMVFCSCVYVVYIYTCMSCVGWGGGFPFLVLLASTCMLYTCLPTYMYMYYVHVP